MDGFKGQKHDFQQIGPLKLQTGVGQRMYPVQVNETQQTIIGHLYR